MWEGPFSGGGKRSIGANIKEQLTPLAELKDAPEILAELTRLKALP